jgi:alkanesulfonate monooxygenase SsuD/methylene tetrahydromethanopterin reductase-like flavin-dependent oxidoreductase (luciferase family)
MTCCRASHPEEVAGFVSELAAARAEAGGGSADGFSVAYQVTIALGDTVEAARRSQREYIDAYYPGFSDAVELADWGPAGTADEVAEWLRTFADAGVTTFICRFASLDQPGQLERMAADVLPVVRPR